MVGLFSCISLIMKDTELMACAQTGSGKTAAFLLPIINNMLKKRKEEPEPTTREVDPNAKWIAHPECVILAPTRELVVQIGKEANAYTTKTPLRVANVYGGTAMYTQRQNATRANIMTASVGRFKG